MTIKIYLLVFVLSTKDLSALSGENVVTIKLKNGTFMTEKYKDWKFPDVESLFNVDGELVDSLEIKKSKLEGISKNELKKLPNLKSLELSFNKYITKINSRSFEGNPNLIYLNLERNNLDYIAPDAFHGLFKRKSFSGDLLLMSNKLRHLPLFQENIPGLKVLSLSNNPIDMIERDAFTNMTNLQRLYLKSTLLKRLPGYLFQNLPYLHELRLSNNEQLTSLDANLFSGAKGLEELYLDNTGITYLPSTGLDALTKLYLVNTKQLWDIPNGIVGIPTLKVVRVSPEQRFLCCAFEMKRAIVGTFTKHSGFVTQPPQKLCPQSSSTTATTPEVGHLVTTSATTEIVGHESTTEDPFDGFGKRRKRRDDEFDGFDGFISGTKSTANVTSQKLQQPTDDSFPDVNGIITKIVTYSDGHVICNPNNTGRIHYSKLSPVECTPQPDALRPCDDIMGNVLLTGLSWVVSIVALLGNSMVFSVLILSRRVITVTKFLLINLSFADLCLALYLFILVSASGHTHGDYYNYVKLWQYGGGCAVSGFLAIFSSQLSMLVLVVTTVERYFAIVYAMHFHRRLTMKHAKITMLVCWTISVLMAVLPLLGANSYNEVAICLPFRTLGHGDIAYVSILLVLNVIFFIFVLAAYIRMYCVVRSPHLDGGPQRNDSEVAKRMALLVFTDFFCWGPIAFVGLLSVFGNSNILNMDVKKSKYLLVIFFPINALFNPFLYAVSTNSFKRDFFDLLIRCGVCQDSIAKANEGVYTNSASHKNSQRGSETMSMTYQSQISRGCSVGKKTPNMLSTLLVSQHNRSSNSPLVSSVTPNDEFKEMFIQDDVFYTAAQRNDSPVAETTFCKNNDNEFDDRDTNEDALNDNRSRAVTAYDVADEKLLSNDRSFSASSSSRQDEPLLDNHTPGFSQYDLSQEAFIRSKETSVLL